VPPAAAGVVAFTPQPFDKWAKIVPRLGASARPWNKADVSGTIDWEETTVRRIECIAENPSDALVAVDERLRRMRREGWQIPDDAAVDLRPSGFGWAARLVLPDRCRRGDSWAIHRRIRRRKARAVSGIQLMRVDGDVAKEA
jgi:hypothetical protein